MCFNTTYASVGLAVFILILLYNLLSAWKLILRTPSYRVMPWYTDSTTQSLFQVNSNGLRSFELALCDQPLWHDKLLDLKCRFKISNNSIGLQKWRNTTWKTLILSFHNCQEEWRNMPASLSQTKSKGQWWNFLAIITKDQTLDIKQWVR